MYFTVSGVILCAISGFIWNWIERLFGQVTQPLRKVEPNWFTVAVLTVSWLAIYAGEIAGTVLRRQRAPQNVVTVRRTSVKRLTGVSKPPKVSALVQIDAGLPEQRVGATPQGADDGADAGGQVQVRGDEAGHSPSICARRALL
jgi:hypothetical protein